MVSFKCDAVALRRAPGTEPDRAHAPGGAAADSRAVIQSAERRRNTAF